MIKIPPILRCAILLLCTAMLAACNRPSAAPALQSGRYRVVLRLPGGELPFGMDLTYENDAWVGYLINGAERLRVSEVAVSGSDVRIKMPGYENNLDLQKRGGVLEGELVLDKLGGKSQHIPAVARLDEPYRFFASREGTQIDVSGRWSVAFTDDEGKTERAVGEFSQARDVVTGTFLTDTGDHRFLEGQVHDGRLYLSTFDGAHAFLYSATIAPADGTLTGDFWSGTAYHEHWTATPDVHATLPDPYALTKLKAGTKTFDFAFPDLQGAMVTASDPRFRGKVLIVALAGSWCPNCHDEAAFLSPLYEQYRTKGLEIVSLMFEHFNDFEHAAAASERFRQHYRIDYTMLIAGISDKDDAAKKLPALDRVYAFPTLIFVDRKGIVRKIHTGFSGPATGDHYTQFVQEFNGTLDELLAES